MRFPVIAAYATVKLRGSRIVQTRSFTTTMFAAFGIIGCAVASAGTFPQWHQWGGPGRCFVTTSAKLADKWPDQGPPQLWSRKLGDGYSTILVDGNRLYTMARTDDTERIVALNADNGETIWEHAYPAPRFDGMDLRFGEGPRSTPLLVNDRLYAVGCYGRFTCLDAGNGKVYWSHDLISDVGGSVTKFGYAASPIRYKDTVIVLCGEKDGRVAAFDLRDGKLRWKSETCDLSYSSPILIDVDGHRQLVILMATQVAGLDPADGSQLWSFKHENQFRSSMNTPIWGPDNQLFISSGGDAGSRVLRLGYADDKPTVKELWATRKVHAATGSLVAVDGYIYGSSGMRPAFLSCVRMRDGEILWQERGLPHTTCVYGDGKVIMRDADGGLSLTTATPDG